MRKYSRYIFEAKHDEGTILLSSISYSQHKAKEIICKMEGCPKRALKLVSSKMLFKN